MNKLVSLSIFFVVFILIILPFSLTFLIRLTPNDIQPPLRNTKKIYGQLAYYQEFVSLEENLSGIGVSIKNPNFANKKVAYVNIYSDQNEVIRKITLNGQNIADGKFVKILFEPIKDSKSKKFIWSISSPESTLDDALEIFLTDKKPSWSLDLKINNEISDQGFSYVTLHKPKYSSEVLTKIVREWFRKIQADRLFFISWILAVAILLGIIFAKFPKKNLKKSF